MPYGLLAQSTQVLETSTTSVFLTQQTLVYFEDATGKLNFDQVKQQKFTPVTRQGNNFGVSGATYWFRFKLRATTNQQQTWLFELAHPLLDQVLFYYQEGNAWKTIKMGDMQPFNQRPLHSRHFVVPLKLNDNQVHTYYVGLKSTSTIQVPITIYQTEAFHIKQDNEQLLLGVLYGILLVMALYNLFVYFSVRTLSYLLYSFTILSGLIFNVTLKGQDLQYLWPHWIKFSSIAIVLIGAIYQVFMLLYTNSFLDTKKYAPLFGKILFLMAVIIGATGITAIFHTQLATKFFIFESILSMPLIILTAIICYRRGMVAARFFILAWVLTMLGIVAQNLTIIGMFPFTFFTKNLGDIGGVLTVILLSLALADNYNQYKKEKEEAQQKMLEMQQETNEKLEAKVKERTLELQLKSDEILTQNEELQQQQEEILAQNEFIAETNQNLKRESKKTKESIRAAKSIQHTILPGTHLLHDLFSQGHFVIYHPKDIVSGDFYWVSKGKSKFKVEDLQDTDKPYTSGKAKLQLTTKTLQTNESTFVAVVDCTGHGVPGAFMSMIGNSLLNKIINELQVFDTDKILDLLHEKVRQELKQDEGSDAKQGMDVCLCKLEKMPDNSTKVTFTGSKRPLYYVNNQGLSELKGDRISIGGWSYRTDQKFTSQVIFLRQGDMLYLTTDGFVDTPNIKRKSFGTTRLKNLLANNAHLTPTQQKEKLEEELAQYQRGVDQRDDITILGIKI